MTTTASSSDLRSLAHRVARLERLEQERKLREQREKWRRDTRDMWLMLIVGTMIGDVVIFSWVFLLFGE